MPDDFKAHSGQSAVLPNTGSLRPIHCPPAATLDIIAVHGMNTDRRNQGDNAWIDPESETNWLRDLLPQELPAARILTYDYNTSTVLKASTTGIEQQALNLLKCLKSERVGNASTRPIIFIAHSLGGILVKNALALAYHGDGKHATTWVFTYGILFFAVPHRATSDATWGKIAGNIIRVYNSTQNTSFLSSIDRDSAYNERLNESFKPLLEAYVFCSICETLPESEKLGVVVGKDSATLGLIDEQECKILLERSHMDICKFSTFKDEEFRKILEPLRTAAKAATSTLDYSPTLDVRKGILRSIASSSKKTPQSVSSVHAERFLKLVLANMGDLKYDLRKLDDDINLQLYFMESLLRRLMPSAALLLGMSSLGPISHIIWALGGIRSLMKNHEKGLKTQTELVKLRRETVTLLDERRSSALKAIAMIRSSGDRRPVSPDLMEEVSTPHQALSQTELAKLRRETDQRRSVSLKAVAALKAVTVIRSSGDPRPMSPDPMEEASIPHQHSFLEDSEPTLLGRIEWIVRELQTRNRRLIDAERDMKEGEDFKEAAKGKTEREVLILAKERIQRAKKNKAPRDDKWSRECVVQ